MSAMKCPDCDSGFILPINSMDLESEWLCSKCQHQQSSESVQDYINYCEERLSDASMTDVENYEKLLQEFLHRLHPHHYIGNINAQCN